MGKRLFAGKRIITILAVSILAGLLISGCSAKYERCEFYFLDCFDTECSVIVYIKDSEDKKQLYQDVHEVLMQYHRLFDAYNSYDGVNNIYTINQNAGIQPVSVDSELFELLAFCLEEGEKIDYRTNIAFGQVTRIWKEVIANVSAAKNGGEEDERALSALLPGLDELTEAAKHVDAGKVILDREGMTVYLEDKDMILDVGAVAKGYAADRLAEYLLRRGIDSACISLSGNLKVIGEKKNNAAAREWLAAIRDPQGENRNDALSYKLMLPDGISMVTSGNYERFVMVDGVRYSHLIDPDTLFPVQNMASVTIISDSSLLADYLSTALFTVDIERGREILDLYEDVEAVWITSDGRVCYTEGFWDYVAESE